MMGRVLRDPQRWLKSSLRFLIRTGGVESMESCIAFAGINTINVHRLNMRRIRHLA